MLILTVAAVATLAGWLLWLVGNPLTAEDPTGDAIFVHAGGQGERIQTGLELLESGAAPVLVLSNPEPGSVPSGLCTSNDAVICVVPSPADTAGEAASIARLIEEHSWDQVIAVTSDYHLRRATMLDRSCTDAALLPVAAPSRRSRRPISDVEVREAIALAFSWLGQRCD